MKQTRIIGAEEGMEEAVALLRAGKLVAFPTETVYGLGADAGNERAVAEIFRAKGRPRFNPLIVHTLGLDWAARVAEISPLAERLAEAFWPGPFTLVLRRREDAPLALLVSAGLDSVAIRVPAHPVARELLRRSARFVAAPSANPSGGVSPTTAAHVAEGLAGEVELVLDGGACRVGLESTVVDATGERPVLLRPGGVTREMIEQAAGPLAERQEDAAITSPGQLASHYAPALPLRLDARAVSAGEALLAFGPEPLPDSLRGAARTLNLSAAGDLTEAAARLFAMLRALDDPQFKGIAAMPVPEEGLGAAINDRLRRAAAPRPK
ncbi:MAG: L-threonylcarbamoyladenylate synthase [Rhodovibrionaceae bacterium]